MHNQPSIDVDDDVTYHHLLVSSACKPNPDKQSLARVLIPQNPKDQS